MVINDLNIIYPKLVKLAIDEQKRQGNLIRNVSVDLNSDREMGNFDWEGSLLGSSFWEYVYTEDFDRARQIYDWGSDEITEYNICGKLIIDIDMYVEALDSNDAKKEALSEIIDFYNLDVEGSTPHIGNRYKINITEVNECEEEE